MATKTKTPIAPKKSTTAPKSQPEKPAVKSAAPTKKNVPTEKKVSVPQSKNKAPASKEAATKKTAVAPPEKKSAKPALTPAKTPEKALTKTIAKTPEKAPAKTPVKAPVKPPAKETVKTPAKAPVKTPEKAPQKNPLKETTAKDKWSEIRAILLKMKQDAVQEILRSIKSGSESSAAEETTGDIYDQASSERDRELELLLNDREREKVHNIDEALLRMSEGEYGICEECDEDIPIGRLKVLPFTRHCVRCKSDLEKMQAQTRWVDESRTYREIPVGEEDEG